MAITEKFREYFLHLNSLPANADQSARERFEERRRDMFKDMLYLMALDLGFSFDKAHLTTAAYIPEAQMKAFNEGEDLKRKLLSLIDTMQSAIAGGNAERVVTAAKGAVQDAQRALSPGDGRS